jgi:lysozyme family protein
MTITYSDTFNIAIAKTLQFEGGYSDNSEDFGGATNFGISQTAYPTLDIKDLTKDQAIAIYYRDFWSCYPYDQMTYTNLAIKVFDTTINLGKSRGIKMLQKCVNFNGTTQITVDGDFGPGTLAAVNVIDGPTLLSAYRQSQAAYYNLLVQLHPTDEQFLSGWLTRAQS